jgi:hypothetical protein
VNALNLRTKDMPALAQNVRALQAKNDAQEREIQELRAELAKLAASHDRRTAVLPSHTAPSN